MCKVRQLLVAVCILALFTPEIPASASLPITSPFGWRVHPITGEWSFHTGADLAYDEGSAIPALFDGIIVESGNAGDGYGNKVTIYHAPIDSYTRYAHLSIVYVRVNRYVAQGEVVGLVGSTGNATGSHLHLEYIVSDGNGGYIYVDPMILWQ